MITTSPLGYVLLTKFFRPQPSETSSRLFEGLTQHHHQQLPSMSLCLELPEQME